MPLAIERGIITGAANAATYKLIFHMGSPSGMPAVKFGAYSGALAVVGSIFYGMVKGSPIGATIPEIAYGPFTTESLVVGTVAAYFATKHMSNEQFLVSMLVTAGFYGHAGRGGSILAGMSPAMGGGSSKPPMSVNGY